MFGHYSCLTAANAEASSGCRASLMGNASSPTLAIRSTKGSLPSTFGRIAFFLKVGKTESERGEDEVYTSVSTIMSLVCNGEWDRQDF
eukprot:bmy_07960T0